MEHYYTDERQIQLLIGLLKAHGIRKVVASPGATNFCFVGSIQNDPDFEMYSAVDERSAAYMACGLSAETGEPVVLTCTGATASRNYVSGLTEAFYRKLPILAVTSTQPIGRIGHNLPQVIDRTVPIKDTVKMSVQIGLIKDAEDEWVNTIEINKALLELNHHGKGPVHINLATAYGQAFTTKELPPVRKIERYRVNEELPCLNGKRVAVFVGAHEKWSDALTEAVDAFCEKYNAAVLCDHTSNYRGKYRVLANLVTDQDAYSAACKTMDTMIHIGDISGAYMRLSPKNVWRVNPDGRICDTFKKLSCVFEMEEQEFFEYYAAIGRTEAFGTEYYCEWISEREKLSAKIPELPFSNLWVAQHMSSALPAGSVVHMGILNSLRSWNYFDTDASISAYCNTGGFGIDGCLSALLGASLADPQKLFFGVMGDLAFFYDMNTLGNRHLGDNIRLLVVNNGKGMEFRNYNHAANVFGDDTDRFIAAAGHFGNQSRELLRHFAEDLGLEYMSACSKEECEQMLERFVSPEVGHSIVFEVFTNTENESLALKTMHTLEVSASAVAGSVMASAVQSTKSMVKNLLGDAATGKIKKMIGK